MELRLAWATFAMQNLVEYIIRQKVYQTQYWKESCFALTAESLIEKAVNLRCAGGTFGGARKPTNFMCLILKMLQIQPDKEIITEYIKNGDFKYVRLLGKPLKADTPCSSWPFHSAPSAPFLALQVLSICA